MVAGQSARNDAERSSKPPNKPRSSGRRQGEQSHSELPPLTLLTVSYEKLLPMIRDLSDFMWPKPIRANLAKRDHNKKCAYHKEHGHTTKSPLLGRKAHKSRAFEAVRLLRNQSWGYFPKSRLWDLQCPSRPQSRNQLHPRRTPGQGV